MILSQQQIDYCMECGVCTGSCPVSRVMPTFSPRQMIKRSLMDRDETVLQSRELWACLTCARCSSRCPVQIDFPDFARTHREMARKEGSLPQLTHHGALQAIIQLQTRNIRQKRTDWARDVGKFQATGDTFYFVGCAPYFDAVIKYGDTSLEMARSVLTLFNRIGIEPVLSDDERCCGHDALWSGNEELFRRLVSLNLEVIRGSRAKVVVFSCPEGYATYKYHVPKYFGELPFEVLHTTEFFARELPGAGIAFRPASESNREVVTYQDPCRLGRVAGIYEAPRELLKMLPETTFQEMGRNRENALCCGTATWIECSNYSKTMQIERLEEARGVGAGTMVTTCPKCRIHLTCAQSNTDLNLNIVDLYTFLLNRME